MRGFRGCYNSGIRAVRSVRPVLLSQSVRQCILSVFSCFVVIVAVGIDRLEGAVLQLLLFFQRQG